MNPGAEPIDVVIKKLFADWEKKKRPAEENIFTVWKKIAGTKAAAHARPVRLWKKTLLVEVDSPAWFYELNTNYKRRALAEMQRVLGKDRIGRIVLRPKR